MTVKELKAKLNALPDGTEDYEVCFAYNWDWHDDQPRVGKVQNIPLGDNVDANPRTGRVILS